jgi:deoxyribonuclease V
LINRPTIGCAKKKLVGDYKLPDLKKESSTDLVYKGEIIGRVLRTKDGVKPVFVSIGHRALLDEATELVLNCTGKYRLPEPTRLAHNTVYNYRKSLINL